MKNLSLVNHLPATPQKPHRFEAAAPSRRRWRTASLRLLPIAEAFRRLREFIHQVAPRPNVVEIRRQLLLRKRILCGEHGRNEPTRQNLCPLCAGVGEITFEKA